jgi:ATP-dependent Zn protease
MARIRLIFIQYKWYLTFIIGFIFFILSYILFSQDRKKIERMKGTMLDFAIEKKSKAIEEAIKVRIEDIKDKEEKAEELKLKIEEIREQKNELPNTVKQYKLRELSDEFKKITSN